MAFQSLAQLKRKNNDLILQLSQLETAKMVENGEMTKHLKEMHRELVAKNTENEAFKEMVDRLSTDNKAFLHERTILKSEYVLLQDQLTIVRTEVSVLVWWCWLFEDFLYCHRLNCTRKTLKMKEETEKKLIISKKK